MRLRTMDWCTTVPQELQQDRPEIKALLKAPGLVLPETVYMAPPPAAEVEGRNPRTVDVRFVRDEIVSATEANACVWRKKSAPKYPDPIATRYAISLLIPLRDLRPRMKLVVAQFCHDDTSCAELRRQTLLGVALGTGEAVG